MAKRKTIIHYNGETHTVDEWAEILGLSPFTIHKRVSKGCTPAECLRTERKKRDDAKNHYKSTLCWDCANCFGGCSWSKSFVPVDGWTAAPTKINSPATEDVYRRIDSFVVHSCPQFIRDSECAGQKRKEQ